MPGKILPEHGVLSVKEYLEMQRSIGNETRFRVLNALVENGAQSASELRDRLAVESNVLHYHLDELVDVELVEKSKAQEIRQRRALLVLLRDIAG